MSRERGREIEEKDREGRADDRNDAEQQRESERLARIDRVASTRERDDRVDRIILEVAIERARADEDGREQDRDPEHSTGDVGFARATRAEGEALEEDQHAGEGQRGGEAVGLRALGPEVTHRDESRTSCHAGRISPRSITNRLVASRSISSCRCVTRTTA